jgi:D-glycero-alpha-D-manno-heptose-7-phosphate kinase
MIITRTPFRISFFGGGTDYPVWYRKYGGAVLSTTINKYCYITCRYLPPFFEHKHRIVWSKIELVSHANEIVHPVVREALKFLGIKNGVEIHHDADIPARSGMGSSSAFTVGLLNALYTLLDRSVTKYQLARDAIYIEQEILKENVGSQDQTAAAFGGFNKIIFGGPTEIEVIPLAISAERLRFLQDRLLLFFTGFSRNASEIAASQIKNTPQKEKELTAMMKLVDQAAKLLSDENKDLDEFGYMLDETWKLKRTLSNAISTPLIDEIYDKAIKAGALGGKLLGAGGGGFMCFYVRPEKQQDVKEALKNFLHVPFRFENQGSQVIYSSDEDWREGT